MTATERFIELMGRDDAPLDEATLLIAAHDHPVDIVSELALLDDLAASAPDDAAALSHHLFVRLDYRGNAVQYYDPRNSYLDEVRRRRLGLPITLSVLMLELGRRRGLALHGVGMPGHFLVGAGSGVFFDPFHGGATLDAQECRRQFAARHGLPPRSWATSWLR
jgi:regulator of sirC expression with transglutaminase-like and TPR domain